MTAARIGCASELLIPDMPRLGFGCGDLYAGHAEAESTRLVHAALDAGIRYFDVARLYGDGSAETVLGGVLPRVRDRVIVASKAGITPWSMRTGARIRAKAAHLARKLAGPAGRAIVPAPPPATALFGAFGIGQMTRSVERSLKALRTDYLDILLLHECTLADAARPEMLSFLERLRDSGKIRAFGVATQFDQTLAILDRAPRIARVAQFASDGLNRNIERLPPGRVELAVTHSPLKEALPRIVAHLVQSRAAATRWTEETGVAADDRAGIAALLLAQAVAANPNGMVLFSTSRPDRIRAVVTAAAAGVPGAGALEEILNRAANR